VMDTELPGIGYTLTGALAATAANNGRRVRKIIIQTRNTTGSSVANVDIGVFRVRAFAMPRGSGGAL
jgi:hypothetical protein